MDITSIGLRTEADIYQMNILRTSVYLELPTPLRRIIWRLTRGLFRERITITLRAVKAGEDEEEHTIYDSSHADNKYFSGKYYKYSKGYYSKG